MPNPQVQRARIGVQRVRLYPHAGTDGPYDSSTECPLFGLSELGISVAVQTVRERAGNTVHPVGSYEKNREVRIHVSAAISDLRVLHLLMGGDFQTQQSGDGEIQYFAQSTAGTATYFRLLADSRNGNGADRYIWPRCKVEGEIGYTLTQDRVALLSFTALATFDKTYRRIRDDSLGALDDHFFAQDGGLPERVVVPASRAIWTDTPVILKPGEGLHVLWAKGEVIWGNSGTYFAYPEGTYPPDYAPHPGSASPGDTVSTPAGAGFKCPNLPPYLLGLAIWPDGSPPPGNIATNALRPNRGAAFAPADLPATGGRVRLIFNDNVHNDNSGSMTMVLRPIGRRPWQ